MIKAALEDWLAAITVKLPLGIQYQQSLAETLFATGYNESQVLEDNVSLIGPTDSNCDVEGKAMHLFHLSQVCSKMPMVRLSQPLRDELQTLGFGTEDIRQKLARFLMIRQG